MPDVEFTNLLAVTVIALLAPLLLGLAPALRVPAVVLEIIAGVVVGPQGLGWVEVDVPISIVALLGLAFLLFLAGLEVDVHRLRGQVLRLALVGYVVTVALGLCVGLGLDAAGWVDSPGLVAVALSATSLGLVVPVLKDAGQVESRLGQTVVAAASVADFAAIVLLSVLFSTSGAGTGSRLVLLGTFAALVAVAAVAVGYLARSRRLSTTLTRLQDTRSRSGYAWPWCCSWPSLHWQSSSGWRASWVRSWPERWSASSTGTRRRTRTSGSSWRRSAPAS